MKCKFPKRKLSEVCIIKPPKNEILMYINNEENVSFVPMEDLGILSKNIKLRKERKLKDVFKNYTYFADNDVLLAKITPCFENGKLGIARNLKNGVGFGSSEYIVFRPHKNILSEYLFYILTCDDFRKEGINSMSGAVGHKRVAKEFVDNFQIPFPPLPEQHRIVKILDEVFAEVAKAKVNSEKNLENTKELFESYLQRVFVNPGKDWEKKKLGEICEKITDGTHQTPKYFDKGYIFLSSRNVTSGKIDWNNIKYIDNKQHLEMHKRVAPKINDILLAKNGTTGVAAIVDRDVEFDIYVSLALLRAKSIIISNLLLYFVNSPVAKKQFNKRLKGTGVPNLHLEEIREVVINFPKSISEQKSIVAKLDALSAETKKLEAIYRQKIADLEELKKSVLKKAFNGEL